MKKSSYILSDKRYLDSNIYYRYGAFKQIKYRNMLCIKTPEGELMEDKRVPYYVQPPFVKDPFKEINIVKNSEDNKNSKLQKYSLKSAFKFSTCGGIYFGKEKESNKNVVIKEGRYSIGFDSEGRDIIERLENEYNNLNRLKDIDGVVKPIEFFSEWENSYLVEEYVEGLTLQSWAATYYPFYNNESCEYYLKRVEKIYDNLENIIQNIHKKGIGIGDLQLSNCIINSNDEITIIDLETAGSLYDKNIGIKTIGFSNNLNDSRKERDKKSLLSILKSLLLPIGPVEELDNGSCEYQ